MEECAYYSGQLREVTIDLPYKTNPNKKVILSMVFDEANQEVHQPKRWKIAIGIPEHINQELSDFSPLMRQLLYNRGFESAKSAKVYITSGTPFSTDPFNLKDMDIAIERLHRAIENKEKIAVYGDYDADGVTSSALLYEFLSLYGPSPRLYIPSRFDEGYGLNLEAIDTLAAEEVDLIVTVDCGVRSVSEIQHAKDLGISMIITDHHQPGSDLPPADAIINPKQPGDLYPEKMLAGVGLAYKLVQAYFLKYPMEGLSADKWLDLVAIGTVADIAPLTGENRHLVREGLKIIQSTNRQGLFSLAQVAGINLEKTTVGNIGFGLGPRLNAAGRIDSALSAVELLITKDFLQAGAFAQKLEVQNQHRQDMTREIQLQATEIAMQASPEAPIIFAARPEFNEGVVGLAASRIAESFYRPAIVGHQDDTYTVASCRSIPEFNITDALDQCKDLLVRHGGHSAAAGFTVINANLDTLITRLNKIASEQLEGLELAAELFIDREIKLEALHPKYIPGILDDLHQLQPTGRGNPDALFCSYNCKVKRSRQIGSDSTHLKMSLKAGEHEFEAIAFRQGHWHNNMPEKIDIAYSFEINEYRGRQTLQLNIKDMKPSREIADEMV
ncbi:MAG: single-stranded-DNA-specific exonuclease RecJ [Anaerolineaceae bacterium]|nr:single-stranded-DNA-specific exonuclease RecJ [Anaerolineaceae bacterium]